MTPFNLKERLLEFAAGILRLVDELPKTTSAQTVGYQLSKSGTSIGANYEESQAAESKADFIHKLQIALKEARETNYWLRVLVRAGIRSPQQVHILLDESLQLRAILSKAVSTAKSRSQD